MRQAIPTGKQLAVQMHSTGIKRQKVAGQQQLLDVGALDLGTKSHRQFADSHVVGVPWYVLPLVAKRPNGFQGAPVVMHSLMSLA